VPTMTGNRAETVEFNYKDWVVNDKLYITLFLSFLDFQIFINCHSSDSRTCYSELGVLC
jgi:hypothetical protein